MLKVYFSGGKISTIPGSHQRNVIFLVADNWGVGLCGFTAGPSASKSMAVCQHFLIVFLNGKGYDKLVMKKIFSCVRTKEELNRQARRQGTVYKECVNCKGRCRY